MVYYLKFLCSLLLCSTILIAQEQRVSKSSYQGHPLFFKAIETAAAGDFKSAETMMYDVVQMLPFHREAQLNMQIFSDIRYKILKKKAAIQLFNFQESFYDLRDKEFLSSQISSIIKKNKEYFPAYLIEGNFYFKDKQDSLALISYNRAIDLSPTYAISFFYRGRLYTRMKMPTAAINDFSSCLHYDPEISQALYQRGLLYSQQSKFNQAIADFEKALSVYNDSYFHFKIYETYNNRGTIYLEQQRYQRANADFEKAISLDKRFGEVYMNRAMAFKGLQVYDSALVNFNLAEEKGFKSADLFYFRGETYVKIEQKDKAISEFRKASAFDENDDRYPYQIAEILIDQQKFSDAIPYLQTVIDLQPEKVWAFYLLAFCFDNIKKYKKAIIYYEAFLEIAPESYFRHITHVRKRVKLLRRSLAR